jgi:uncharacterized coiled-coil protein SlyX
MSDLYQRNFEAVAQKLREMDSRLCDQDVKIRSLSGQVSDLSLSLQNLQQQVMIARAMATGRGPST